MSKTMALGDFYNYVRENRKRIADVYREIEEIQYQFNELYARQLEGREKLITSYVPLLLDARDDLPAELGKSLEAQEQVERQLLQQEIVRLQGEEAEKRQRTDQLVIEAQRQVAQLREANPILNQQEEELKARRVAMEQELRGLDMEIRQLRWFPIGWLTQWGKRRRLRRQRMQLVENLQAMTEGIRAVRGKWQEEKKKLQDSQANLQSQWQSLSVETAQLRAKLDHLSANIDELSKRNAAQNWLSQVTELPVEEGPWRDRLIPLVELNRNKADYEAGLKSVSEILGLLTGLGEGMDRFIRSVGTVYEEQRRYKLPPLTLNLSDAVLSFHAAWPEIQSKVKDEKYLGAHPLEFTQRVQGFMRERLNETAIQKMFEDMGEALTQATKTWR